MSLSLRCFAALIALGLGACAPAKDGSFPSLQAYENYRQLLRFDLIAAVDQAPAWQRTPDGLRRQLGICTADLALANVGLDRIGGLDTYARDPRKLPLAYRQETLNLEASALAQPAKDGPGVLEPFCKDTAAQIKDYAK